MLRQVATDQSADRSARSKIVDQKKEANTLNDVRLSFSAYCLLFLVSARETEWALSTLDDALGAHRLFLIGDYGRYVLLLEFTQLCIAILRVGLVPGEALEVSLKPGLFGENFAAPRINLLAHLDCVLDE